MVVRHQGMYQSTDWLTKRLPLPPQMAQNQPLKWPILSPIGQLPRSESHTDGRVLGWSMRDAGWLQARQSQWSDNRTPSALYRKTIHQDVLRLMANGALLKPYPAMAMEHKCWCKSLCSLIIWIHKLREWPNLGICPNMKGLHEPMMTKEEHSAQYTASSYL